MQSCSCSCSRAACLSYRASGRAVTSVVCLSQPSEDLYSILDVSPTASQQEIKAAFRRRVHDLHPDKHAHKQQEDVVTAAFLQCKLAYDVLSNAQRRSEYDGAWAAATGHQQQQEASDGQQWSPYNGWAEAYHTADSGDSSQQPRSSNQAAEPQDYYASLHAQAAARQPPPADAAAATIAAGVSSSGFSDWAVLWPSGTGTRRSAGNDGQFDPYVDMASNGGTNSSHTSHLRAVLLQQHEVALEQFGSFEEAVELLTKRDKEQTLKGLAEADYDQYWDLP